MLDSLQTFVGNTGLNKGKQTKQSKAVKKREHNLFPPLTQPAN